MTTARQTFLLRLVLAASLLAATSLLSYWSAVTFGDIDCHEWPVKACTP